MANYQYDEGGGMASYFPLTFLSLILFPLTFSLLQPMTGAHIYYIGPLLNLLTILKAKKLEVDGCQCTPCVEQRARIRKNARRSILQPKIGRK